MPRAVRPAASVRHMTANGDDSFIVDGRALGLISLYGVCPDCGAPRYPLEIDGEIELVCTVESSHAEHGKAPA